MREHSRFATAAHSGLRAGSIAARAGAEMAPKWPDIYAWRNALRTRYLSAAARCDVALIDIRAPLQSARQTISSVAAALPSVPIIAMSRRRARDGPAGGGCVARELGVTAVLVKPFDRDALMRAIERAL